MITMMLNMTWLMKWWYIPTQYVRNVGELIAGLETLAFYTEKEIATLYKSEKKWNVIV